MLRSIKESQLSQLFFHSSGAHHFNPQHPLRLALDGWIQSQITCQQLSLSQGACFWVLAPSGPQPVAKPGFFSVETWRKAMEKPWNPWIFANFLSLSSRFLMFLLGVPMGFPIGFPSPPGSHSAPIPRHSASSFSPGVVHLEASPWWWRELLSVGCCRLSSTLQILQILPERIWLIWHFQDLSSHIFLILLAFFTYVGHVFHCFSLWKAWDFQLILGSTLGYPGINSKSTSQIAPVTCPSQRCVASGARAVVKLAQGIHYMDSHGTSCNIRKLALWKQQKRVSVQSTQPTYRAMAQVWYDSTSNIGLWPFVTYANSTAGMKLGARDPLATSLSERIPCQ